MSQVATIITPVDHGRRMTLEEFEVAEAQEGRLYELGRGRVIVTDVPKPKHGQQVDSLRHLLELYRFQHPGVIHVIAGGSDCEILVSGYESERHPDLAVYKTPPPSQGDEMWRIWVPEIVVEVVSSGSEHRDCVEKPEEYLAFGVHEYWTVDAAKQQVLVLRRSRGRWEEHPLRPGQTHRTHLLPEFELDIAAVLDAAANRKRKPAYAMDAATLAAATDEQLKQRGTICTPAAEAAFRAVPRHLFVPEVPLEEAYAEKALITKKTAEGRPVSSCSQPAIVAIMLEQLDLRPGQRVLEIGAGTAPHIPQPGEFCTRRRWVQYV